MHTNWLFFRKPVLPSYSDTWTVITAISWADCTIAFLSMKILQTTISLWLIACRGKILPLPRSEFWPGVQARITREPERTRLIGTAQEIKMKKHSCEFPWFGQFQCCFITQTCTVYIILHCRRRSGKWNGCSSRRRTPWKAKINSED